MPERTFPPQDEWDAFIGVGSNLDPEDSILRALPEIRSHLVVLGASRFYRNPAYGPGPRPMPPFINGVLRVRTSRDPWSLKFEVLRRIEKEIRRERTEDRYSPRTLDLDLLVYGDIEVCTTKLVLPDPEIPYRAYLAVPLSELLPGFRPPGWRLCLREIARYLDTRCLSYQPSFTRKVHEGLGLEPIEIG